MNFKKDEVKRQEHFYQLQLAYATRMSQQSMMAQINGHLFNQQSQIASYQQQLHQPNNLPVATAQSPASLRLPNNSRYGHEIIDLLDDEEEDSSALPRQPLNSTESEPIEIIEEDADDAILDNTLMDWLPDVGDEPDLDEQDNEKDCLAMSSSAASANDAMYKPSSIPRQPSSSSLAEDDEDSKPLVSRDICIDHSTPNGVLDMPSFDELRHDEVIGQKRISL